MIRYGSVIPPIQPSIKSGFIKAYQEAFASPPYYEHYTADEVLQEVWQPHIESGKILIASDSLQVIGFACAIRISKAPLDVQDYVAEQLAKSQLPRDYNLWYFSELGVISNYRHRGIGSELVRHMLTSMDFCDNANQRPTMLLMRTAEVGSNSVGIFKKAGWRQLPDVQDVSSLDQVLVNGSQSQRRIYLCGETSVLM